MALPASGVISVSDINTELSRTSTAQGDLNSAQFRDLAGVASGAISMSSFYGKSSIQSTFVGTFTNNTSASSYTFSSVATGIGNIIVAVHSEVAESSISTPTVGIGGVGATSVITRNATSTNPSVVVGLFRRVTTNGTNNIIVSFSTAPARCMIGVWRLNQYSSATPTATTSAFNNSGGTGLSATLSGASLPAVNSIVIAATTVGIETSSVTWTNVTADYNAQLPTSGTGTRYAGGDTKLTATGNYTVTTSHSNSTQPIAMVAASFK